MLVLTRNINEDILLALPNGDIITIKVVRVNPRTLQVGLGFIAPLYVAISRQELGEPHGKLKS